MTTATKPRRVRKDKAAGEIASTAAFVATFNAIVNNVTKVIKGKDDVVKGAVTALLAGGHVLFEDMPGTGKTMLARSMSQSIGAHVSRIQCTPDLMPGDISGTPVLDRATGEFVFRKGPVFANVLLVDEVNRATPKTQSALLEAMQEKSVTVDGHTHMLPNPFFVLATQNPIELAGTFPLPEAQLDRFLFKLSIGYPSEDSEVEVMKSNLRSESITALEPVVGLEEVLSAINYATGVTVSDPVLHYIARLVGATRDDPSLQVGASARASLALMRASRVAAASQGRDDVLPDDVKSIARAVIGHRVMLDSDAVLRDETIDGVIDRIVARIKVPTPGRAGTNGNG
ncbi:MAG: MoxR-like ATPase [Glaciecola sp.]